MALKLMNLPPCCCCHCCCAPPPVIHNRTQAQAQACCWGEEPEAQVTQLCGEQQRQQQNSWCPGAPQQQAAP